MVENYHVIEEKEILHELTAELLADVHTYMDEIRFDTDKHPDSSLAGFYTKLVHFWHSILGNRCNTEEDMKQAKSIYERAKGEFLEFRGGYHG